MSRPNATIGSALEPLGPTPHGLQEELDQFFPAGDFQAPLFEMLVEQGVDPFPRRLDKSEFKEGRSLLLPQRVSADADFHGGRFSL